MNIRCERSGRCINSDLLGSLLGTGSAYEGSFLMRGGSASATGEVGTECGTF
jgi:hypothetical protein